MNKLVRYVAVPAAIGSLIGLAIVAFNATPERVVRGGYADAVEVASPSVVNIYSSAAPRNQHPICALAQWRDLCARSGQRLLSSLGSGVIVREDGYIVTNEHVINNGTEILIAFADGRQAKAAVVGRDLETDLAVIKVDATGLTPIEQAPDSDVRVGDVVLAIGNPFGIGQTVSLGIVSAKGRYGITRHPYDDFIQTDAAINPGNSGGALIDETGRLVGINTLIIDHSEGSEGIGFAIPSEITDNIVSEIIEHGEVQRGWLGVDLAQTPTEGAAGLQIHRVHRDSPAQDAGLLPGDVIVAIDGAPALNSRAVLMQVAMIDPGAVIQISFKRDGLEQQARAVAQPRPAPG